MRFTSLFGALTYGCGSDFTQTDLLEDFYTSLEASLEGKSGEGAIYMGASHAIRFINSEECRGDQADYAA